MPTNITDADEYTATIVAPADGDPINGSAPEEMGQGLANRTYNHKLRLDAIGSYVQCAFSGTSIAQSASPTISETGNSGEYTVAAGSITITNAGVYEYAYRGNFRSSDTASPSFVELWVKLEGSASGIWRANRFSATAADDLQLVAGPYIITAAAGDELTFELTSGSGETTDCATVDNDVFLLKRIDA